MCGIAGKITRHLADASRYGGTPEELYPIAPRGPDGYGFEILDCHRHQVSLVHSRLSILDLSNRSRQPMHEPVSGWWVVYNGEVYNYVEVRAELQALGWVFRSTGDTEVLLKAWVQWGIDGLQKFNGMFAFAAFHPASGQLWLVRDRFGVKPLAWGDLPDGGVAFSSSVAGIAQLVRARVDVGYCARGLRYKVFETAQSGAPFDKVHVVPAGGWVKFQIAETGLKTLDGKWYDLIAAVTARSDSVANCADADLIDQCRELLESAVGLRLRSDVPVAISLSGGLDSSTVAALATRKVKRLRGFTYGAPDAGASEGPEVRKFSDTVGVEVAYVWPRFSTQSFHDALERTMAFQEAPFSGLSLIAQNEVYRTARQANFKVLLGGQGGDELFAGYRKFFIVGIREALTNREPWNTVRLLYSFAVMLVHEAAQARTYWENISRYHNDASDDFRLLDWRPATENLWGARTLTLAGRQIEDVQQWSLPTLLRYEDRNSMGYGVESRLPFMDYRLLELALALPNRLKISNGYGKWALRRITAGCVPDSIRLQRRKRGFDVTQNWVEEGIGQSLRRMIFDHRSALSEYLRPRADLDRMLSDAALANDSKLLNEALMLAWLTNPVRIQTKSQITERLWQ